MSACIGIDLGTTACCVAVYHFDGRVEVIPNSEGNLITPSYVAFSERQRLIGDEAKIQVERNVENTLYDAKRLIGRKFSDHNVQSLLSHVKCNIVQNNGEPCYDVICYGEQQLLSPTQVSGMILSRLKSDTEKYLGYPISEAVITVPAYFNNKQREETVLAAQIAGLKVLRIINEPTAAILAYGHNENFEVSAKNILVYDLGGGTFDVTIVECDEEVMDVRATSGDSFLGGRDFDRNLADFLTKEVDKQCGAGVKENKRSFVRLQNACNLAKHHLSSASSSKITIDSLVNGNNFKTSVSRARFEQVNKTLFEKTFESIDNALKDSGLRKDEIDAVLLVGGSTRIVKIREMVNNYFPGVPVVNCGNPEETVARGAAIQAGLIKGKEGLGEVVLLDVCPLSLGTETQDDVMSVIIKRNSSIPCEKTGTYVTTVDNQKSIRFAVYEGERGIASENNLLDTFNLKNIKDGLKGEYHYDVTFTLDVNGILNVKAVERETGLSEGVTIERQSHDVEEIQILLEDEERFASHDRKELRRIQLKHQFEDYLYKLRKRKKPEDGSLLDTKITDAETWLEDKFISEEDIREKFNSFKAETE
ncbi:uncharacterized protein LOC142356096 [Convolutriloba macropyga]|uniref:uncharacterized protein LOC142356096 n=1 Tax=Convolutriloba macropyga TaxID=536237 RepID=UPI003F5276C6